MEEAAEGLQNQLETGLRYLLTEEREEESNSEVQFLGMVQ